MRGRLIPLPESESNKPSARTQGLAQELPRSAVARSQLSGRDKGAVSAPCRWRQRSGPGSRSAAGELGPGVLPPLLAFCLASLERAAAGQLQHAVMFRLQSHQRLQKITYPLLQHGSKQRGSVNPYLPASWPFQLLSSHPAELWGHHPELQQSPSGRTWQLCWNAELTAAWPLRPGSPGSLAACTGWSTAPWERGSAPPEVNLFGSVTAWRILSRLRSTVGEGASLALQQGVQGLGSCLHHWHTEVGWITLSGNFWWESTQGAALPVTSADWVKSKANLLVQPDTFALQSENFTYCTPSTGWVSAPSRRFFRLQLLSVPVAERCKQRNL